MFRYEMNGGQFSSTFSTINNNTNIWGSTAGSFQVPNATFKGSAVDIQGVFFTGASISEFISNGYISSISMNFKSQLSSATAIGRGVNYYVSQVSSSTTFFLPNNPKVGDYIYYDNQPSFIARLTITIDGNGNNIRSSTNSVVSSITWNNTLKIFHYDGTNWNVILD